MKLVRFHFISSLFTLLTSILVNIHTHMIPLLHSAMHFIPHLNYLSVSLEGPEKVYTAFAMLCLFSSVLWHTMSGCAHRAGMELCARVDYVGIGWYVMLCSLRRSGVSRWHQNRLISASVGTVVYYGFSCHSQAAALYLSLCVVTGILGSIFPFMRWFNEQKYRVRSTFLRISECNPTHWYNFYDTAN